VNSLSSHHHHPLLSPPLPHPSYSTTFNTTSTTYPSLPSPSPLLRDVGWYLKCYLSPPGAPQPTWSQQTQRVEVWKERQGGRNEGREVGDEGAHFRGVDNRAVCTSHAAPFSLPKHFFCSIDNGAVCTSPTAPFSLAKHLFSAASIMGQCAPHMPPRFLSWNTFFPRRR